MYDRIDEILRWLNRWQQGRIFKIVATVIGLLLVGAMTMLAHDDSITWFPEPYRQNLVSSTVLSTLAVVSVVWFDLTLTAGAILFLTLPGSIILGWAGAALWSRSMLGVGVLIIAFLLLLNLARFILSGPSGLCGVARLVLDEAIRMKLALVFIVGLIIFIPILAGQLDPHERLQYRLQTFLSYGTGVSYGLLAVMTLFLSTATVAFEQRDKTIFQIVSKPLNRGSYLLGKWLGVVTLNAILLLLTGGSVFWFTQYLGQLPAQDEFDALAVSEQVLTARVGVRPSIPDYRARAKARAAEEAESDPELQDDPVEKARWIATRGNELMSELQSEMLSIPPTEYREYEFKDVRPVLRHVSGTADLTDASPIIINQAIKSPMDVRVKSSDGSIEYLGGPTGQFMIEALPDQTVVHLAPKRVQDQFPDPIVSGQSLRIDYYPESALTFRFKINSGDNMPDVTLPITIWLPGDLIMPQKVVLVQTQNILIPAGFVGEDGTLTLRVVNGDMNTSEAYDKTITFPYDGLEVLYKVDTFEWNYFRAMTINWLKLSFLAMLGICAATFASFPVACMLAFAIFLGAETGPFLAESLEYYEVVDKVTNDIHPIRAVVFGIAKPVNLALQAYGSTRPTQNLIEGRLVSWGMVGQTFLVISVLWMGLTGLMGWLVFSRRQLAIYSGHQ